MRPRDCGVTSVDDRYEQASTHHQLGVLAQEQRRRVEAERYYEQALAIKVEFDDRHSQAGVPTSLQSAQR